MGLVDFREPFSAQLNQGIVINQGKKMSKSLGNGVNLGDQLEEFGVDAVRLTLVFAGPPEDDIDWADVSPGGLAALPAARLAAVAATSPPSPGRMPTTGDVALRASRHKTLHDAAELVESLPLQRDGRPDDGAGQRDPQGHRLRAAAPPTRRCARPTEAVAILLSLVAPYTAEEMWERLGHEPTVARAAWPEVDEALLVEDTVTAVVQVKGKVRARLEVSPDVSDADLEAAALADAGVQRALDGAVVRKVIVRAPKLVNIVV